MDPFQAVKENKIDKIKRYINQKGVDLEAKNERGKTLLQYAKSLGKKEI